MGDRISIQFKNKNNISVALFSHWGGEAFKKDAKLYVKKLKQKILLSEELKGMPLGRLEPETVMVDFIRDITKDNLSVENDLYLGKDENDGDNSDNGNVIIDLEKS